MMFASRLSVAAILSIFASMCMLGCTTGTVLPDGADGDQGIVDETPDQSGDTEGGDEGGDSTEVTPPSDEFDIECETGDEGDSTDASTNGEDSQGGDLPAYTLHIFHNGSGSMCLAALDWLADAQVAYTDLIVEEHLSTDSDERVLMSELEDAYEASEGVSTSFQYLPIIFFGDRAFSGFNDEVEASLTEMLEAGL